MRGKIDTYEIGPNPDINLEREVTSAMLGANKALDSLPPSQVSYIRNLNAVARHAHDERMVLRNVAQEWKTQAIEYRERLKHTEKRMLELQRLQLRLPIWLYRWLSRDLR